MLRLEIWHSLCNCSYILIRWWMNLIITIILAAHGRQRPQSIVPSEIHYNQNDSMDSTFFFTKLRHVFSAGLTQPFLSSLNPVPYFVELRLQNILVIEDWLKVTKFESSAKKTAYIPSLIEKSSRHIVEKTCHPVIIFKQPKFIVKIKKKHCWQVFFIVVGFKQFWDLKVFELTLAS